MLIFMPDATRILSAMEAGDPQAADELLPLVYDELRKLGGEAGTGAAGPYVSGHRLGPRGVLAAVDARRRWQGSRGERCESFR
jgi:hypothetical protein